MGNLFSYFFLAPKVLTLPSPGPKTYFRWEIPNFRTKWANARSTNTIMLSNEFPLITRPSVHLSLRFDATTEKWSKNFYGVAVRNFGDYQFVEFSYKIWFENNVCKKLNERSADTHIYDKKSNDWGWGEMNNLDLLKTIYDNNETLYICCEIFDAHPPKNVYLDFCLNQWKLYEEGIYDTIIYVGKEKKEFRIIKFPFMAQSPVFKAMFQGQFKEAKENEVTIEDMDEETMMALTKYVYMAKVDDNCLIEKLFEAADKYQIDQLKEQCVERMVSTLNDKNMLQRLALAEFYNQDFLKTQTLNYLETCPRLKLLEIMMSQEWQDFVKEKPCATTEISKLISEKLK